MGGIGFRAEGKIHGHFGAFEASAEAGWICGTILIKGRTLSLADLRSALDLCQSETELKDLLRSCDGFFSFVVQSGNKLYVAVDRARSRPLFYRYDALRFVVSDSIAWVCRRFSNTSIDSTADLQLLKFGYAIGRRTLVDELSQVQAGELILWSAEGCARVNYHDYLPRHPDLDDAAQPPVGLSSVQDILLASMEAVCNGRYDQFVVPLSSGCDSRALLAALCAVGKRRQILAFTYGRRSSENLKVAAHVANALGVEWLPIEYSNVTWQSIVESAWLSEYLKLGFSAVSLPNIQAIPAMYRLSLSGLIDKSAVFLPAHSGFFPGGRLPGAVPAIMSAVNAGGLTRFLYKRLGIFRSPDATFDRLAASLTERVSELEAGIPGDWGPERVAVALIELTELVERQAKFIVNSNRYYDFFGFAWWMPFWEKGFIDFWSRRGFSDRIGKVAWGEATRVLEQSLCLSKASLPSFTLNSSSSKLGGYVERATEYFHDQNRLFDLVDFRDWLAYRYCRSSRDGSPLGSILHKVHVAAGQELLESGAGMYSPPVMRGETRTPVELCYNWSN